MADTNPDMAAINAHRTALLAAGWTEGPHLCVNCWGTDRDGMCEGKCQYAPTLIAPYVEEPDSWGEYEATPDEENLLPGHPNLSIEARMRAAVDADPPRSVSLTYRD